MLGIGFLGAGEKVRHVPGFNEAECSSAPNLGSGALLAIVGVGGDRPPRAKLFEEFLGFRAKPRGQGEIGRNIRKRSADLWHAVDLNPQLQAADDHPSQKVRQSPCFVPINTRHHCGTIVVISSSTVMVANLMKVSATA